MTRIRRVDGSVYEAQAGDILLGGVEPSGDKGDKFRPSFEVHRGCDGEEHTSCEVAEKWIGPDCDTFDQACDWIGALQTDLKGQGLTDWEPAKHRAKA